ncbi:MAG: hypothetical protein ACRD3F_14955 [Acidobacteriaceae bacterium]
MRIPAHMTDLRSAVNAQLYSEGPSFLLVVILSGIALFIMLILAYLVLIGVGDKLVPSAHVTGEATAHLVRSALSRFAA